LANPAGRRWGGGVLGPGRTGAVGDRGRQQLRVDGRRDPSYATTVVIVITANDATEAEQQALDAGADAFLTKAPQPASVA